jgi:hypothetical protein
MEHLYVTIDRFEDNKAVLILPDSKQLVIPIKFLGENLKAGDALEINFTLSRKQTKKQETIVRKVLNKLLKQNQHETIRYLGPQ